MTMISPETAPPTLVYAATWAQVPDKCACRYRARSGEDGWERISAHPGCPADHGEAAR